MRDAFVDLKEKPGPLLVRDYTDGHNNKVYEGYITSVGPCDNLALTARVFVPVLNHIYNVRTLQTAHGSLFGVGKQTPAILGDKVAIEFQYGSSNLPKITNSLPNTRGLAEQVLSGKAITPKMFSKGNVISAPPVALIPEAIRSSYFGDVVVSPIHFLP